MKHAAALLLVATAVIAAVGGTASACTSITLGRKATVDGSVMTSHTCDSREDRTWLSIVSGAGHGTNDRCPVYNGMRFVRHADQVSGAEVADWIPQARETFGYINTAYPCMNERQVAIGESTFGGRKELRNKGALISCDELCRLALERCGTAREAIRLIDALTKEYGYNDGGECLTIADKTEVWHLEIVGCGEGEIGAIWAAQRVPDGHVGVNANASRIRTIDLEDPDYYMASDNVFDMAARNGWWDPDAGESFEFCYVYDPEGRRSMAARRREWRVFDLLAPSLELDPNDENYPFSVKPDTLVTLEQVMAIFRDTFEGTEFDMTKFMIVEGEDGTAEKSPYANPFMDYDMMPLFKVNGGWGKLGERCIARYYCTYVTVTQSREWLPDPIGGIVWLGWDNPAMTTYAPLYCGILDVPDSYKVCGRPGFNRECSWWAFNRVADLSAQKWGHMRVDVDSVRTLFETEALGSQTAVEEKALELYGKSPKRARKYLTGYVTDYCDRMTKAYWDLGDHLWSKYTGKF